MNQSEIALAILKNPKDILHCDQFSDLAITEILGSGLEAWLSALLKEYHVKDIPVLHPDAAVDPQAHIEGPVYIAEGAIVEAFAFIKGPAFIGPYTEVRHTAYIRGNVYAGRKCVIGHATEVKGSVFFDQAKAGHFAYVGDSLLGFNCNLGAGTKLANLKLNHQKVTLRERSSGLKHRTELKKLGAIIGAECQIGCNAVLSPGAILLPGSFVLPTQHYPSLQNL